MDKLAEQCRAEGSQPMMTTVLQPSKIALVLNSSVVTSNVEEAINHAKNTNQSKHICAKGMNGHQTLFNSSTGNPLGVILNLSQWQRELKYPNTFMIGKTPAPKKKSSHVVNIERTH